MAGSSLEKSFTCLALAVTNIADGVVIANGARSIEYVNPAFELLTGYEGKDVVGASLELLLNRFELGDEYDSIWKTISSGCVWTGELDNLRKDSGYYRVHATVIPVHDDQGNILAYVATLHERPSTAAKESGGAIAGKMEVISERAHKLAHDLKNIMGLIIGNTEIALFEGVGEKKLARQSLEQVLSATEQARPLLNEISAIGEIEPNDEWFDKGLH